LGNRGKKGGKRNVSKEDFPAFPAGQKVFPADCPRVGKRGKKKKKKKKNPASGEGAPTELAAPSSSSPRSDLLFQTPQNRYMRREGKKRKREKRKKGSGLAKTFPSNLFPQQTRPSKPSHQQKRQEKKKKKKKANLSNTNPNWYAGDRAFFNRKKRGEREGEKEKGFEPG